MRCIDWERKFNEYIVSVREREFAYGTFDCLILVADWVQLCRDEDVMDGYRGRYDDVESAAALLREEGAGTLYNWLQKHFGKSIHGAMGQRGDIAYHEKACGLVVGRSAMFCAEEGYLLVPMIHIAHVFPVR